MPGMDECAEPQWSWVCALVRRQHYGVFAPVAAIAAGANPVHAMTASTKFATPRRMVSAESSTAYTAATTDRIAIEPRPDSSTEDLTRGYVAQEIRLNQLIGGSSVPDPQRNIPPTTRL